MLVANTAQANYFRQLFESFETINSDALRGDSAAQTKCFGKGFLIFCSNFCNALYFVLGFPSKCTSFKAPVLLDCMNALWLESGCIAEGNMFPGSVPAGDIKILETKSIA